MKLGFFIMPVHPPGKLCETLNEDREAFILADKLGYTEGYCGEHLTDLAENIPSSLMFCASLAGFTSKIKLGTAVMNLPHGHPVVWAAQAALVDNLLQGRFLMGIGAGILRSDAEALGILDQDRGAMFAEAIDHILAHLGRQGAVRSHRQILEHLDGKDAVAGNRHRQHRQAVPEAASADPRYRDRAAIQGAGSRSDAAAGGRSRRTSCI